MTVLNDLQVISDTLSMRLARAVKVRRREMEDVIEIVQRCPCCRDVLVVTVPDDIVYGASPNGRIDRLTDLAYSANRVHSCADVEIDLAGLSGAEIEIVMQNTERQAVALMERFVAMQAVASKRRSPAWLNEGAE